MVWWNRAGFLSPVLLLPDDAQVEVTLGLDPGSRMLGLAVPCIIERLVSIDWCRVSETRDGYVLRLDKEMAMCTRAPCLQMNKLSPESNNQPLYPNKHSHPHKTSLTAPPTAGP